METSSLSMVHCTIERVVWFHVIDHIYESDVGMFIIVVLRFKRTGLKEYCNDLIY
jgi:DNA replication protein DnaC